MQCYKPEFFSIKELVHPQILKAIGATNSWMRLDADCLRDLDTIRKAYGSEIYINKGRNDSRGLRPPNDYDGSFYSVHKQGKAFDLVPKDGNVAKLFVTIKMLIKDGKLKKFNTLEDLAFTPSWVHVACMNHDQKPYIIKP